MPFSIDNSPQLSLVARLVATTRWVLTIAGPLTLDPLMCVRRSEVSYPILGLHGAASVLLFMVARFGPPRLIRSEHHQSQSQRRVHKQGLKHGQPEVTVSKTRCRAAFACETDAEPVLSPFAYDLRPGSHLRTLSAPRHAAASGESRPKYLT
jgi:hypothetical protein